MIYTNRLDYEIDYDAMNRDFLCIKLERDTKNNDQKWIPTDLIQKIAEYCQPVSVMHQFGKYVFLLFRKSEASKSDITNNLLENNEYREEGLTFSRIVFSSKIVENDYTHLTGYWVLQLLFNTLAHADPEHPEHEYQNLYGRLFIPAYGKRRSKKYQDVFEIKVEKPNLLTIHARRFAAFDNLKALSRWQKYNHKSHNVYFVKNNGKFCRSNNYSEDIKKHGTVYVNHPPYKNEKPSISFIDTASVNSFNKSRIGMYIRFFEEAKSLLSKYLKKMELLPMPERDKNKDPEVHKLSIFERVKTYFADHGLSEIQLLDHCKDSTSEKITMFLKHHAEKFSINIRAISDISAAADDAVPVISIIHNQDFYADNKKYDPHCSNAGVILQHVTVEDFLQEDENVDSSASRAKFLVLLRDLAVKRDLKQARADFLSITENRSSHQYSYHLVDGFGDRHKKKPMDIYSIRISEDFTITAEHSRDEPSGFELDLAHKIDEVTKKLREIIEVYPKFEGWVEDSEGNCNFIYYTEEIVMPDLSVLKKKIQDFDRELPEEIRAGAAMADVVRKILEEDEAKVDPDKIEALVALLQKEKLPLTKNKLKTIIKTVFAYQSGAYRSLTNKLRDEYGVLFVISRGKDAEELHEYRAGLRYWEEDGIGHYYSGGWKTSGLKAAKVRADHIRVVVPDAASKLFFEKLLPGMNEEIVHMAARSVLPAGFKYAREFKRSLGKIDKKGSKSEESF